MRDLLIRCARKALVLNGVGFVAALPEQGGLPERRVPSSLNFTPRRATARCSPRGRGGVLQRGLNARKGQRRVFRKNLGDRHAFGEAAEYDADGHACSSDECLPVMHGRIVSGERTVAHRWLRSRKGFTSPCLDTGRCSLGTAPSG